MPDSSSAKIVFHDVVFSFPYKTDPPRHIYSDVTFPNGLKETLSILFDEPDFTEHANPQAGLIGGSNGFHFLVSVNLEELPPLKQFKSGIPIEEIQCKESLILMTKDGKRPACVTPSTASELSDRSWSWVLDVEHWSSATMTLSELCAAEFDKIMNSVKSSCGLPDSDVVCSPPTLMGSLMNAEKKHTGKFVENNCARIIDEWSGFLFSQKCIWGLGS